MKTWPTIRIADVLHRADRFESKDELTEYQFAGTFSYAKGIFVSDRKLGSTFGLPKIQRVRTNDFVYCKIMAWEGAFGIVHPEADNCVLSGAFVAYEIDSSTIEPKFLEYLFKVPSHWKQIGSQSTGTNVRRQSLHPLQFEGSRIPCPPLVEQQTIVARLNQLADKVRQVNEHLAAAERDAFRLLILMATRRDLSDEQRIEMGWKETTIGDFTKLALFPVKVDANEAYPNLGIYNFARGLFEKPPIEGTRTSAKTLFQIRSGQFIYSRLFAFEGAYAMVSPEYDGFYVSNEFPTFDIDLAKATPSFLMTLFLTEQDWQELAMTSKGVGDRRLRIQPDKISHRKVWLPPLEDQKRIEKLFDAYHALKAKHAKIREANQALIPATLERLFSS